MRAELDDFKCLKIKQNKLVPEAFHYVLDKFSLDELLRIFETDLSLIDALTGQNYKLK